MGRVNVGAYIVGLGTGLTCVLLGILVGSLFFVTSPNSDYISTQRVSYDNTAPTYVPRTELPPITGLVLGR